MTTPVDQPPPPTLLQLVFRGANAGVNWLSILSAGLVTTAIAMLGVHIAEAIFHESVLSIYVYHIFPVGALIVGLFAGSGYWLAVALLNARLSKPRVWFLVTLQIVAYFLAQYVEFRSYHLVYRDTLKPVGFWEWFHLIATSYQFHFGGGQPVPLGGLGYLFRAFEIAAFATGTGLLASSMVDRPYCTRCGRYRKAKPLATIPASVFLDDAGDDQTDAQDLERKLIDGGIAAFDALATIAQADDVETFRRHVADFPPQKVSKSQGSHLQVELRYCPGCMEAQLTGRVRIKRPVTTTTEYAPARDVSGIFAEAVTS